MALVERSRNGLVDCGSVFMVPVEMTGSAVVEAEDIVVPEEKLCFNLESTSDVSKLESREGLVMV